jgi:hypothetical protein
MTACNGREAKAGVILFFHRLGGGCFDAAEGAAR